jgi:hypothetical protein
MTERFDRAREQISVEIVWSGCRHDRQQGVELDVGGKTPG